MIPADFDYLRPATITEALEMASRYEDATFLAGGHALLRNGNSGTGVPPPSSTCAA